MFVNGMHVHAKYDQCMHNHCYIIHIHVHLQYTCLHASHAPQLHLMHPNYWQITIILQYTCLHACIVDTQTMALLIHVTYRQSLLTFLVIHFQL